MHIATLSQLSVEALPHAGSVDGIPPILRLTRRHQQVYRTFGGFWTEETVQMAGRISGPMALLNEAAVTYVQTKVGLRRRSGFQDPAQGLPL